MTNFEFSLSSPRPSSTSQSIDDSSDSSLTGSGFFFCKIIIHDGSRLKIHKNYLDRRLLDRQLPLPLTRTLLSLAVSPRLQLDVDVVLGLLEQVAQLVQAGGGDPGLVRPLLGYSGEPDAGDEYLQQAFPALIV